MLFNRGEKVQFTIKRNNLTAGYIIKPKKIGYYPPSGLKIYEMLVIDERKVSLAVIVTDVKNNTSVGTHSWEDSIRHQLQGSVESYFLKGFGKFDKFSLVDRSRIENILNEYRLNMTGLTSDDARAKIGNMTGATNLLIVSYARYSKMQGRYESCEDTQTGRLIDIESGKVLAVDQSKTDCE
jgi:hypothetical protein